MDEIKRNRRYQGELIYITIEVFGFHYRKIVVFSSFVVRTKRFLFLRNEFYVFANRLCGRKYFDIRNICLLSAIDRGIGSFIVDIFDIHNWIIGIF